MAATRHSGELHLPDLTIRGFRGIEDLTIKRLGRVTLFTGENGVGKTTLLDAVRVFASRGGYSVLMNILRDHEEVIDTLDEEGDPGQALDVGALFHGRSMSTDTQISIGPRTESQQVRLQIVTSIRQSQLSLYDNSLDDVYTQSLSVKFRGSTREIPTIFFTDHRSTYNRNRRLMGLQADSPVAIECKSLGPSLPSNGDMSRFWDKVALTDDESRAVQALSLIFGQRVERVAMVGDDTASRFPYRRRAVVRIDGREAPVPLKSLGDGAVRIFGVALALANSQGGFLVIDEAENGLHHSVQRDFWNMVLRTAHENNVQVLATTHGWDCVVGFAQAATGLEDVDGTLVRLDRKNGQLHGVEYSEHDLQVAADQGIEVR